MTLVVLRLATLTCKASVFFQLSSKWWTTIELRLDDQGLFSVFELSWSGKRLCSLDHACRIVITGFRFLACGRGTFRRP